MTAVAQVPGDDVHPLLRHPRPITRDSAKAQRMLGLIADTEDKSAGLHRQQSKTTKWLERPFYTHVDVSDVSSEQEKDFGKRCGAVVDAKSDDENNAPVLEQWPDRPTSFSSEDAVQNSLESKLNASIHKNRPGSFDSLHPVLYASQHFLTPEWTTSPATMSPNSQQQQTNSLQLQPDSPNIHRSSFSSSGSGSMPQFLHPQTWPVPQPQQQCSDGRRGRPVSYQPPSSVSREGSYSPLGKPPSDERRPRPISFATYSNGERRKSKIASSRGLRNNSYPNFSRPISEAVPNAAHMEVMGDNASSSRFPDCEVGPPSAAFPVRTILEGFEISNDKDKGEKKPKKRWSAIPDTFKKFTTKRSSGILQDPTPESTQEALRRMNLTEDNLTRHEDDDALHTQALPSRASVLGVKLLPTPTHSPLSFKHPMFEEGLPRPFAPWADGPPSPTASSPENHEGPLSPSKKGFRSKLSVENLKRRSQSKPHSRQSSVGMPSPILLAPPPQTITHAPTSPRPLSRKGTPSLQRTCIICKATRDPSAFICHQISGNCWHEPATCTPCLKSHIERCVTEQGWDHCSCPECGEHIGYDDMAAFANDGIVKWED